MTVEIAQLYIIFCNPRNTIGDTEFKKGQIVGEHLARVSVTKTVRLSRATVSRVKSAEHQKGWTAFNRCNCGCKWKLSEKDVWVLTQTESKKHKTAAAQLIAQLEMP